jgi:hypothetical protein
MSRRSGDAANPKSGPFLPRASNVEQNFQNDVDFPQARSSYP